MGLVNEDKIDNVLDRNFNNQKESALVHKAFASVKRDLRKIQLFHTDRGREFKNEFIDHTDWFNKKTGTLIMDIINSNSLKILHKHIDNVIDSL